MPLDPFPPADPVIALCTFTPNGSGAEELGIDDCWVEYRHERGKDIYIVHAQYIVREGSRFYIEGEARQKAEVYLRDLAQAIGVTELQEVRLPGYDRVYVAPQNAVAGTLANPFTALSVADVYPVSVESRDSGGRAYGFDIRFEKPNNSDVENPPTIDSVDFTWGAVDIGNQPGVLTTQVENSFVTYTVRCAYRGTVANASVYAETLASALGLDVIHSHDYPRGAPGNRGVIKSYNQTPDTLAQSSAGLSLLNTWPESVEVTPPTGSATEFWDVVATFRAVR